MFFNNGVNSCCGSNFQPFPVYWGNYGNNNNNYAIILVLFILLVIVIGARNNH